MRVSDRPGSRRQAGFTYLWLLLVIAFISGLMALAVELQSTASQRDREMQLIGIGKQFRAAIGRYHEIDAAGRKEYPPSLEELLRDNRVPGIRRHLRQVFIDPMTGKRDWALIKVGDRIVGVHSLSEQLPIKQDGFDAEEGNFRGRQSYAEWAFTYPSDLVPGTEAAAASASAVPRAPTDTPPTVLERR